MNTDNRLYSGVRGVAMVALFASASIGSAAIASVRGADESARETVVQPEGERRPARLSPAVLTVTGRGVVTARPDRATVRLGAVAQGQTAAQAQEEVSRVLQATLKAIEDLKLPGMMVQTSTVSLQPVYAHDEPRDGMMFPRITGYQASNTIQVRLDNLGSVGSVIDTGLKAGANQLDGVWFELKDDLEQRSKALEQAAHEARRKAQVLSSAVSVRLDGIQEISEGGIDVVRPMYRRGMETMAMADGSGTPIEPGDVRIEAMVTVTYRISE
ncbi:MAG: SIMPL domain-containing protein [Phycisphaerales bacterium]|nr:SIMPL domain-containing protein [Phycisphaerales bacterium]